MQTIRQGICASLVLVLAGLFCFSQMGSAQTVQFTRNITIGMTQTLSSPTPNVLVDLGKRFRDGSLFWYENIPGGCIRFASECVGINLVIRDDKANATLVKQYYTQMADDPSIHFLIGPSSSDFSIVAKSATEPRQKILYAPSAPIAQFYLNAAWSFPANPSARTIPRAAISIMRIKGVKTIAILYDSTSTYAQEACASQRQNLLEQGITLVGMVPLGDTSRLIDGPIRSNITGAVQILKDLNPDAVLGCIHAAQLQEHSLLAMRNISWVPKMYTVAPDSGSHFAQLDNTTKNAFVNIAAFDPSAKFAHSGTNYNDSYSYAVAFKARFGYEPDSRSALATLAHLLLQRAIESANSTDPVRVRDAIRRLDVETFMGRVTYATDGANQNTPMLQQWQNGVAAIIAPPLVAVAEVVYPMPRWHERTFVQQTGSPSEIAVVVITALAAVYSIILLILVFMFRANPTVRASSPTFLISVLLGSLLLYASNLASLYNIVNVASCHLQAWLLGLGFIIMFGSLFAKSWRVYRLYSNAGMDIIRISDLQVFFNLLIWVSIMAALIISLSAAGNLQPLYVSLDIYRPFQDYYICAPTNGVAFTAILAIILAYCGAFILLGLLVAYKVRSIPYSVYDESKTIAFSIYNVSFFVILLCALRLSNAASREALFLIQSIGIVLCVVVTLSTLLFSKVTFFTMGEKALSHSSSRMGISKTASNRSYPSSEAQSADKSELLERIRELEEELKKNNIPFPKRGANKKKKTTMTTNKKHASSASRQGRGSAASGTKSAEMKPGVKKSSSGPKIVSVDQKDSSISSSTSTASSTTDSGSE